MFVALFDKGKLKKNKPMGGERVVFAQGTVKGEELVGL